jgi:hypothetical protein
MQGKSETKTYPILDKDETPCTIKLIGLKGAGRVRSELSKVIPGSKIDFKPGDIMFDEPQPKDAADARDRAADKILAELVKVYGALKEIRQGFRRDYNHLTVEGEDKIYATMLEGLGVWDDVRLLESMIFKVNAKGRPGAAPNDRLDSMILCLAAPEKDKITGKIKRRTSKIWELISGFLNEQGIKNDKGKEFTPDSVEARHRRFIADIDKGRLPGGVLNRETVLITLLQIKERIPRDKWPGSNKYNLSPAMLREYLAREYKKRKKTK